MKTLIHLSLCLWTYLSLVCTPSEARDGIKLLQPSKVDSAKARLREQSLTEWMKGDDFAKLYQEKSRSTKPIIYFEYNTVKEMWRGVYSDKVNLRGSSWWVLFGETEMEAKLNQELTKGLEAAFIVRSGNYYAMLFVPPEQYANVRKALDEIGVGVPKLR